MGSSEKKNQVDLDVKTTHLGFTRIDIYDVSGRLVKTIFNNQVDGGIYYKAEFRPNGEMSSIYFYRIKLVDEEYFGKVLYNK